MCCLRQPSRTPDQVNTCTYYARFFLPMCQCAFAVLFKPPKQDTLYKNTAAGFTHFVVIWRFDSEYITGSLSCVRLGQTVLGWAAQCWAGPHSAGLGRTVLGWAAQCWAGPHSAGLGRTVLGWAAQCWAGPHSAGLGRTVLGWAAQCWAGPHSAGLDHTVLGSI